MDATHSAVDAAAQRFRFDEFDYDYAYSSAMHALYQLIPVLSDAVSQAEVEAMPEPDALQVNDVKYLLLQISHAVLQEEGQSSIWKTRGKPSLISLKMLSDRLHTGKLCPHPIQLIANDTPKVRHQYTSHSRTGKPARLRPLEDFEDLYHALLAKIQEMHQQIALRVNNGFVDTSARIYASGPTISALSDTLIEFWTTLNDPKLVKTLDAAVRRSRIKHLHATILAQLYTHQITKADAYDLLTDLYDPDEYAGVAGLAWIGGWAPAMITAFLAEKYRVLLQVEKEAEQREAFLREFEEMAEKVQKYGRYLKALSLLGGIETRMAVELRLGWPEEVVE
ncbi:hypothetical protein CC78DRAFT_8360 [Lojkania enalia]|uniref:Uncharacterized protein n=1 Tax=Lojkania enalia TaxID=147567 RepID=A0A9P4ND13_9PLEO|nr:hypothetical protein CC78DRAFT_8360 [Didymosphaeria enalia]